MSADGRKNSQRSQFILMMAAGVLAVVSGMAGLARAAAEWGPRVGDVIAFDAGHHTPFDIVARLTVHRTSLGDCVLDLATIQRSGGSLVVEQRGIGPEQLFRAHWAGTRTSFDPDDCGAQATLELNRSDINILAAAAGGFGVEHSSVLFLR
jgi:hypothetical protein